MTAEELQHAIEVQTAVVVALVALHQAELKKLRKLQTEQGKTK